MGKIKLSKKQKDLILALRAGAFLYENKVTPAAKWCLGTDFKMQEWGNVHGANVKKVLPLLSKERYNTAVDKYVLNDEGKSIEL